MRANDRSRKHASQFRASMEPLLQLFLLLRYSLGWVALSICLGVATIASGIGLIATSAYLISLAALHPSIAVLEVAIVGVRFFGLSRGVFRYLERLVSHSVNFRLLARLRVWFYDSIEPLAPALLLSSRSGDLLSRAMGDVDILENFYIRVVSPPFVACVVLVGMSLFVGSFDVKLVWLLCFAFLIEGFGLPILIGGLSKKPGKQWVQIRAQLETFLVDGIHGLGDILSFGGEKGMEEHLFDLEGKFSQAQNRMAQIGGLQSGLTSLITDLSGWFVLLFAISLVNGGHIEATYLAMIVLGVLASFEAVIPLPAAAQNLESNLEAGKRIFEMTKWTPEIQNPAYRLPPPQDFTLVMNKVSFQYPVLLDHSSSSDHQTPFEPFNFSERVLVGNPKRNPFILKEVSFRIAPGDHIALVGPNGSGKTTLVNLLMRYWNYQKGEILLGGKELKAYQQEDVRRWMGLLSQSTYLFDTTIRENLLMANPNASSELLTEVIHQVQLDDFITDLPKGIDTWVGEHGFRLSGGERQRIAIARSILQDTPILLLDEPTKNLDPLTEEKILQLILDLNPLKSILWITHHLVRLEQFDEIWVMQSGRIVEQGSHADLWQVNGLYRQMWSIQQKSFDQSLVQTF